MLNNWTLPKIGPQTVFLSMRMSTFVCVLVYHRGVDAGGQSPPMKILGANISFCPPPPPIILTT